MPTRVPRPTGRWSRTSTGLTTTATAATSALWISSSGATRLLVGAPKMKDWFPRWSPDGKWIAFLSQRTDYNQVWLIRPDGTDMRQVTDLGTNVEEFSWSPDGTRLAIIVNRRGRLDLAATSLTSGKTEEIKVGRGVYSRPQWSPDGAYHLRRV